LIFVETGKNDSPFISIAYNNKSAEESIMRQHSQGNSGNKKYMVNKQSYILLTGHNFNNRYNNLS
jgi:hypothetical protein